MQTTGKLAILLATYQGSEYLREQMESLMNQTVQDWVIYIHDDGSTDGTGEILEEYQKKRPKKVVVLNGKPCGGAKQNFFYLMQEVDAPYIMFCDQDDVWKPDKIAKTMRKMEETENRHPEIPCLVFSELTVVDADRNVIAERMGKLQKLDYANNRIEDVMVQNHVTGCTVMINRALLHLARKRSDDSGIIMHDWWCAMIAADMGKTGYIEEPLMEYRQHGKNSVGAKKIGSIPYIAGRLLHGMDIRNSLLATQKQAQVYVNTFHKENGVLAEYATLFQKKKSDRLWFYKKHHIRKSGWIRNLGLWIWG